MTKGLFIVFEGVDGSGKSTQMSMLKDQLEKHDKDVVLTREPTDGIVGELIRRYAESRSRSLRPETEALLFAADRVEHSREIKRLMEEGKVVISDRYLHSSLAYQGAAGVDRGWIRELNKHTLQPDLVILLDIDPERSLNRVTYRDKTVFEEDVYLRKVREIYREYAEKGELISIDASKTIDEVQIEVIRLVEAQLSGFI
jgi:dTMP kinase